MMSPSFVHALRLALLAVATTTPHAPAHAAGAADQVTCHLAYGGETVTAHATRHTPRYRDEPTRIGSYFLFRIVLDSQPAAHDAVKLYTYAAHDDGPVLIHQARFARPSAARRAAGGFGFTGLQSVYEPVRDGELRYWCELGSGGAAPGAAIAPRVPAASPAVRKAKPSPSSTVRLLFAGDLMLDEGPGRTIAAGGDPLRPFAELLREADYRIANLECPVATVGQAMDSKIYTFRAAPRALEIVKGRFDAVSVANNHSGDYGRDAFTETLAHLHGAGIAAFGGGRNLQEAHAPLWIERSGLRIAVLAYDEFKPRAFEAGPSWPGVAWAEDSEIVADIHAARRAGADVVIPFLHWGWEREPNPGARQRELARLMIDAGADAVVGAHPHVTQGADLYRGRPIVWSLGNFVFDGFELPAARVGWVLRMTLDARGVQAWDTVAARIDGAGTPTPASDIASPCGRRGVPRVLTCTPGQGTLRATP